MNEALCSILCAESPWGFDPEGPRGLFFNQDGTGEIWCRCNFNVWLLAKLEWKSLPLHTNKKRITNPTPPPIDESIFFEPKRKPILNTEPAYSDSPSTPIPNVLLPQAAPKATLLGHLRLQITVFDQLPPKYENTVYATNTLGNSHSITEGFFSRPQTYTVRLERGNFIAPCGTGYPDSRGRARYAFRMVFDRSPYPVREMWRDLDRGPGEGWFWTYREFVARWEEDADKRVAPMNDDTCLTVWDGCLVS